MLRTFAAASLLVLAATSANAASAYPETASITVAYGDLNLAHSDDAKLLATRLDIAAKDVCTTTQNAPTDMKACMKAAIGAAISNIEAKMTDNVRVHLAGL